MKSIRITPITPITPTTARPAGTATIVLAVVLVSAATLGLTAQPASAAPIIQEVFYDAAGPDSSQAFTEIFGPAGMLLDGWSLVGINGGTGLPYRTLDLTGATIPGDGLLVVATSSADPGLAAIRDFVANIDWQNGPDAVQLLDPFMSIIDAIQYGDAGVNNAGFGATAFDAPAGSSLSRDLFGTQTFDNASDFTVGLPSPGMGPTPVTPQPVPEPSTLLLLTCGLLPFAARRRCICSYMRLQSNCAKHRNQGTEEPSKRVRSNCSDR